MEKRFKHGQLDRIELTIPLKEQYLTILRLTLSDLFDKMGLSVCDTAGYKVALTDACRNLMYFAHRHLCAKDLRLVISLTSDRITISCNIAGKCYCRDRVAAHPVLDKQEIYKDIDLLVISSLVDHYQVGLRMVEDQCSALIRLTKFLPQPQDP
ncbi:MAG: hypothetical protein GX341_01110 [Firmicutes bacterium]|nr:hypothetical protein [Bacillota bacterium]